MPYFSLKYFDSSIFTDTQGFIITEETSALTIVKMLEISALVKSVMNSRAVCLAVPASFSIDPATHSNTLYLLEDLMLTLINQLKITEPSPETNPCIQGLMSSLYAQMFTDGSSDFQQPLPLQDENPSTSACQTHAPLLQKRVQTSDFNESGAKKSKLSSPHVDTCNNNDITILQNSVPSEQMSSTDDQNYSVTTSFIEPSANRSISPEPCTSYTLPIIELMPDHGQFTLIYLSINDYANYLQLLHRRIVCVLQNELFFSDPNSTEATTTSKTSLLHLTLERLLNLLHQQRSLINLITDAEEQRIIQAEHHILTQELVIRLQAAGFSDETITNMTTSNITSEQIEFLEKENPSLEPLLNLVQEKTPSEQSSKCSSRTVSRRSSLEIPLSSSPEESSPKKTPFCVPLCFIKTVKKTLPPPHLSVKCCYTLVYQVKKNNTSICDCYSNCRITLKALLNAITTLCEKNGSQAFTTNYMCPFTKRSLKISLSSMLQHLFFGIQENIIFLKTNHPILLIPTPTHNPLDYLERSLELVKEALQENVPKGSPSDILNKILIADPHPYRRKEPLNKKLPGIRKKREFHSKTPLLSAEGIFLNLPQLQIKMPLFCCAKKKFPAGTNGIKCTNFSIYYQLRMSRYSLSHLIGQIRPSIIKLTNNIQSLLNPNRFKTHKMHITYLPFDAKNRKRISHGEALIILFDGLNENLNFLGKKYPSLFMPTHHTNPKLLLEKTLDLVKKALPQPLPSPKEPSILPKLLDGPPVNPPLTSSGTDNEETSDQEDDN
ncbi:hypothetical protein CLAVI_000914 [Candidatus Clavichlamydia salmonicola]|uniref:hypothetical protein n=1 Tax=Candidatus Clavichlamydia salmonicola TaxID=469812 RepID=UPI001891360B|nr:hypothetical protein [Candidatus Clavichlamydia salmonicola]MBF5051273.1 hypothetical protein [Candidatus Clavichlamydia salmonicola]